MCKIAVCTSLLVLLLHPFRLRLPRAFPPARAGGLLLASPRHAAPRRDAPWSAGRRCGCGCAMEPPTSHVTNAFSDSDSASVEEGDADADADVEALRRLSDNLAAAFRSPEDFAFLADARIAVPGGGGGGGDLRVHRCVLSARSPFLRGVFARRAAAAAGGGGEDGSERLELRELLGGGGEEVEVGYEALRLVLDYLYSGRVGDLPKAACLCVDEDCAHVGCHPAVAFMAQVLFAASTFQVAELTNLFQVRLFAAASPFPLPFAMLMSCQFISSLCLLGCVLLIEVGV